MPEGDRSIQIGASNLDLVSAPIDYICQTINQQLTDRNFGDKPAAFSDATKQLFLNAWALAGLLKHTDVKVEHLVVSLLQEDPKLSEELGVPSQGGASVMLTGALVRLARFRKGAGSSTFQPLEFEDAVVRWIGEANRFNAAQNGEHALKPQDLAVVYRSADMASTIHSTLEDRFSLIRAAGGLRSQVEKIRQNIANINQTTSRHKSYTVNTLTDKITAVEKGIAEGIAAQLPGLLHRIEDVDQRAAKIDTTQLANLAGSFDNSNSRIGNLGGKLEQIANLVATGRGGMDNVNLSRLAGQITAVEHGIANVRFDLPRPPSAGLLLLSIAGVLAIGVTVGLALSNPSSFGQTIADVIQQVSVMTTG